MWRFTSVTKCVLPLLCLLLTYCAEDIPEPLTEEELLDIIGPQLANTNDTSEPSTDGDTLGISAQPTTPPANVSDTTPPRINGGKCVPKDGVQGLNPLGLKKLTIVFDEPVVEARVISVDPRFPYAKNLSWDGMVLTLTFLDGYEMSFETEYRITLSAKDKAGNEGKLEYEVTTMVREQ